VRSAEAPEEPEEMGYVEEEGLPEEVPEAERGSTLGREVWSSHHHQTSS